MRTRFLLTLLSLATATTAAAQAIVIPVRCEGACPADGVSQYRMAIDSVRAWANVENGQAQTSVYHLFRNETAGTVDGAFFFPLPADAAIQSVSVADAALPAHDGNSILLYNQWSGPEESRWIMEGRLRGHGDAILRAYAGEALLHVAVRSIPPGGVRRVHIIYSQPLRAQAGVSTYRYPLSVGADAAPIGHVTLGMEVKSEYGFHDLHSPSHPVNVEWGTESVRCSPRMACGTRGATSERIKVVRMRDGAGDRSQDFTVRFTLAGQADAVAFAPEPQ